MFAPSGSANLQLLYFIAPGRPRQHDWPQTRWCRTSGQTLGRDLLIISWVAVAQLAQCSGCLLHLIGAKKPKTTIGAISIGFGSLRVIVLVILSTAVLIGLCLPQESANGTFINCFAAAFFGSLSRNAGEHFLLLPLFHPKWLDNWQIFRQCLLSKACRNSRRFHSKGPLGVCPLAELKNGSAERKN